jgi:pyrroline-5-carboxylate reductase
MPNLPALVGQCAAGFCRGKHATSADADHVRSL